MPRDGSNVYSQPAGTAAGPAGTTISSANFNTLVADLVTDANLARPIVAGGTGATNAAAALTNIGGASLSAIAGLATSGIIVRTGAGTAAARTITPAGANITITNGDGVAGNPTVALTAGPLTEIGGLTPVQGDLLYRNATVVTRLPKGTAGQVLRMNTGATEPEWATPQTITATGTAPLYACRAFANFNGPDFALRGVANLTGYRVTGGHYVFAFIVPPPDGGYVVNVTAGGGGAAASGNALTAWAHNITPTGFQVSVSDNNTDTNADPTWCMVSVFR